MIMAYLVNLDQRNLLEKKEFARKKGNVIYCEATHVCYIDAREVTHVILMSLEE